MSFRKDIPPTLLEILKAVNINKKLRFGVLMTGVIIIVPLYKLITQYKLVPKNPLKVKEEEIKDEFTDEFMD